MCLVTTVMNNRKELLEEALHSWEGITKEVKTICQAMGLPDATQQYVSRQEAKEAMNIHHLITVKNEMEVEMEM